MRVARSLSDAATINQSSEEARLPAVAVQRVQPRDVWRSYDNSDQWLTFNLGGSLDFDFVAVLYHNADASALWRVRVADSEANLTAAPAYDSTTMSMRNAGEEDRYLRFHSVKDIGSQSNQWVRLDFTTLTGILTLDIGRVMICEALIKAPAYDWQYLPQEDVIEIPTVSGTWTHTGRKTRRASWTYPGMTDDQSFANAGELDYVAHSSPVVACIDETDASRTTDWTYYGIIKNVSNRFTYQDVNFKQIEFSEFERP